MFSWLGSQFDSVLTSYVIGVVSALMAGIAPIAGTTMTLWVALYGWAVLRGDAKETLTSFVWRLFKIGSVLAISLQSAFYLDTVYETANALAVGVTTTFIPDVTNPAAVASPYAILDTFNDKAGQLVIDLMKEAGITRLDLVLAAVITAIGNVVFLCTALFVVTLAKTLLAFVVAVGPIFVFCLAWRPTNRFFDSWLSMVLNTIVLTWFAYFALGVSTYVGDTLVQTVQDKGGLSGPAFNVVGESLKYCVVMILMAIICFQAPSLASALTGGVAVQQGLQMVQNAMMVAGLRSVSARGPTGPGGVLRAGTGPAYALGHALGSSPWGASRAIQSGYAAARTAAYKRAAQRGRA